MDTWGIGPFDNDSAADPSDYVITPDAERAVAAAALAVAQHPDGEPACSNYGLSEPLPDLPHDLRELAVAVLEVNQCPTAHQETSC